MVFCQIVRQRLKDEHGVEVSETTAMVTGYLFILFYMEGVLETEEEIRGFSHTVRTQLEELSKEGLDEKS